MIYDSTKIQFYPRLFDIDFVSSLFCVKNGKQAILRIIIRLKSFQVCEETVKTILRDYNIKLCNRDECDTTVDSVRFNKNVPACSIIDSLYYSFYHFPQK